MDKNGEPVFKSVLVNIWELLGSEDPVRYLGTNFLFPVCGRHLFCEGKSERTEL